MNAIFFGAKRAHQATLRVTRKPLALLGLTAARFDMLTAIWQHPHGVRQRDLGMYLGVTRATISRMLLSLVELGLVRRRRSPVDRRWWIVQLTRLGHSLISRATRLFIHSGAAQLAVDHALCGDLACSPDQCEYEMTVAEGVFDRLRDAFGDAAHLHYAWHPDD